MNFQVGKLYRIRGSAKLKYRCICTDNPGSRPLVFTNINSGFIITRSRSGAYQDTYQDNKDILPNTRQVTMYMNIYKSDSGSFQNGVFSATEEEASQRSSTRSKYIKTIPVTFEVEEE